MEHFFDNEAQDYVVEYNLQPEQIGILKNCINGDKSPTTAAEQLATYPSAAPTPLGMQHRLGGLWTLLNDTAVLAPASQPTIISILRALRQLPKVDEPTGEGEGIIELDEGDIWGQLSWWSGNLADSLNGWAVRVDQDVKPAHRAKYDRAARKAHWISASTYVGRLVMSDDEALAGYGGFLEWMTFILVRTLEKEVEGNEESINANGKLEPGDLEAMAQLLAHAAPELYRLCKECRTERSVRLSKGELWQDQHGRDYSVERWEFWKQRWRALSNMDMLSDDARQAARQALEAMDKVEVRDVW